VAGEPSELDAALERVIEAARAHLASVKAADGRTDDDDVWNAYVALNNASYEYDELLLDAHGEVTPWDVESIDPDEAEHRFGTAGLGVDDGHAAPDPHPGVLSVRQRRDYRVPSVAALLRVGQAARQASSHEDVRPEAVTTVADAVLELLQSGDGSLGALDVPELDPLDGVVTVSEVAEPLNVEALGDEAAAAFETREGDRMIGRLDEHPYVGLDADAEPADERVG
jgi:hypothetical protein